MTNTVMLIHGAWLTPLALDNFRSFFEARGYACLAPAWPYMDRSPEELRTNPDPRLAKLSIKELVDYYDAEVRKLSEPPILVGHSFGGLIVQMLLDRGLGAAGVALDPAPPRGVLPSSTAFGSAFPVLFTWNGWNKILRMSFQSFRGAFANRLPQSEMRAAFERYIVPAPGRIFFQAAVGIGNGVNFSNPKRAPLLLMEGENDRTVTPEMVRKQYQRQRRSPSPVEYQTFRNRSHWLINEPGWERIAGRVHNWILETVPQPSFA